MPAETLIARLDNQADVCIYGLLLDALGRSHGPMESNGLFEELEGTFFVEGTGIAERQICSER